MENSDQTTVIIDEDIEQHLNNQAFVGGGANLTMHGNIYHLKLLMLCLCRATFGNYQDFRLVSEFLEGDKFDDIFFQFKQNNKWKARLLQAKHSQPQDKYKVVEIKKEELLSCENRDFSLQKYFRSYLKIKERTESKSYHSLLSGCEIEDVIIITNIDIKHDIKTYFKRFDFNEDALLNPYKDDCYFYKLDLKDNDFIKKLRDVFNECSDFQKIINEFNGNKQVEFKGLFREYFYPLIREVFNLDEYDFEYHLKLRQEFPNDRAKTFANAIKEKYKFDNFIKIKKNAKIYSPINNPELKNVDLFITYFQKILLINSYHQPIKIYEGENREVFDNISMLAGYMFVIRNKEIRISSDFINIKPLPKNVEYFRKQLILRMGDLEFKKMFLYSFDIKIKGFPYIEEEAFSRNLPKLHTEDDIKEFCDKFKVIPNYCNKTEIVNLIWDIIKKNLKILDGKVFNSLLYKNIVDWMSTKISNIKNRENVIELFEGMQKDLFDFIIDGINHSYFYTNLSKYEFRNHEGFIDFLRSSKSIFGISAKNLQLSCMRVVKTFQNIQKLDCLETMFYTRKFGYIFFKIDQLKHKDFRQVISNVCISNEKWNLIVIECNIVPKISIPLSIFSLNQKRKIVIIKKEEDSFDKMFDCDLNWDKVTEDDMKFGDLTDESQKMVLEKNVIFQGYETNLGKLLNDGSSTDIVNSEIISKVIDDKNVIRIGNELPISLGYDPSYYIDRQVTYENILKYQDTKIIDKNHSIDVKKQVNVNDSIMKNKYISRETIEENELIKDLNNSLVVISDTAGMGKSTVLTNLSINTKKKFPNYWIQRIDLLNCSKMLQELEKQTKDNQKLNEIDSLISLLGESSDTKLNSDFEIKLFKNMLENQRQVLLFFDGFDEISPGYKDIVLNLLKSLIDSEKIIKMIVTTRPNMLDEIQKRLNNHMNVYTLNYFTEDDQINFLTKFWSKHIENDDSQILRIGEYARALLLTFSTTINDEVKRFTGIPLQMRMLADIFMVDSEGDGWGGCRSYLNSSQKVPNIPNAINLINLYDKFARFKFNIYCNEKKKDRSENLAAREASEDLYKIYLEDHQLLAAFVLFETEDLKKILSFTYDDKMKNLEILLNNIRDGKQRQGIIDKLIDDKPRFIHMTFVEYFAANFISKMLRINMQEDIVDFVIKSILMKPEYQGVRVFLGAIFENDPPKENLLKTYGLKLHKTWTEHKEDFIDSSGNTILHICSNNSCIFQFVFDGLNHCERFVDTLKDLIRTKNDTEDTVLHLSVKHDNLTIVKMILLHDRDIINARNIDGKSALHKTAKNKNLQIVNLLIENGCDIKCKDNLDTTLLHFATKSANEDLCKLLLDEYNFEVDVTESNDWRPLHIAVKNGIMPLVKLFLERGSDVTKTIHDGQTVLHLAARSGVEQLCKMFLDDYSFDIDIKDNDNWTPLHIASDSGELNIVKFLIDRGSDIRNVTNEGKTVLHCAARSGNEQLCKMYLDDYNVEIDLKDNGDWTPLHVAFSCGELNVVRLLLDRGSDIRTLTKDGRTVLHHAAKSGDEELCKMLLDCYNFDVDVKDNNKCTPLHVASDNDQLNIVKLLIERGSDVKNTTVDGRTVLHFATKSRTEELCKMLLDTHCFDIEIKDNDGLTPLHSANDNGKLNIVKFLIDKGSNVRNVSGDGQTVLHHAARSGNERLCKMYLDDYHFDVDVKDNDGWTPLHIAFNCGKLNIVKLLINSGSDIRIVTIDGQTVLHCAAKSSNERLCKKYLDDYQFDIHAKDNYGWTPLHVAFNSGNLNVVQLLIDRGSDIRNVTIDGYTVLHLAAKSGSEELCNLLFNDYNFYIDVKDNNEYTPLHVAIDACKYNIVKLMINRGSDIRNVTKDGQTILHHAARTGNDELCKMLINEYNFDINVKDNDNWTPIDYAFNNGYLNTVKLMIDMGSDIRNTDKDGQTVFHHAARSGNEDLCKMLLDDYSFDIDVKDDGECTPLFLASHCGQFEIVKLLIDRGSDVRNVTTNGQTVLYYATKSGNEQLCRFFVESFDLDTNTKDNHGWTPLLIANYMGKLNLVKFFIENGGEIKDTNNEGQTVLHCAAISGNEELCTLLIENYNFCVNIKDNNGLTPLHCANCAGKLNIVKFLIGKGSEVGSVTESGQTVLHCASRSENEELCKLLIEDYKFSINAKDGNGMTPLHIAFNSGHVNVVKFFISRGSDVHCITENGQTVLHCAARSGNEELCKLLLEDYNVDINVKDINGMTPLHYAKYSRNFDVVQFLIKRGSEFGSTIEDMVWHGGNHHRRRCACPCFCVPKLSSENAT